MVRQATLEALNRLPYADATHAARRIVAHFYGVECGIESIAVPDGAMHPAHDAIYVNRGDTYDETLLRDADGWHVTSWGDWYEQAEHAYAEESGESRCGYCGEWSMWECPTEECSACEGFGLVGDENPYAECAPCGGDGHVRTNDEPRCTLCGYAD